MRLVFVNHCPPCLSHVCAVRVREFARAAARRGRQVALLTQAPQNQAGTPPDQVEDLLARHDWSEPLALSVRPRGGRLVSAARTGALPGGLRQAVLAASYLLKGGVFPDWSDAARPLSQAVGRLFRPQAVWASFGNSDCWRIAQQVARAASCPWVGDVKDPLSVFLPAPVRRQVLSRYDDAAAFTALSQAHADDAQALLGRQSQVVYSGIEPWWLEPPAPPKAQFRVMLVGALYGAADLDALLTGFAEFLRQTGADSELAYAGGEGPRLRAAAARYGIAVTQHPFLKASALRDEMAAASVLAYVRNPRALFQHKLFELIAMARPILCLPPESPEALQRAEACGGRLLGATNGAEVADALTQAWRQRELAPPQVRALAQHTWDAQAETLLAALEGAA